MIITKKILRSASRNGKLAFKRHQLEILGISWPPVRGWLKRLNGSEIPDETWHRFLASKEAPPQGRQEKYLAYLESDHWKELRRSKKVSAARRCECCGAGGTLHAHHINYKNLTDCTLEDLAALCVECHNDLHFAASQNHMSLDGVLLPQIKEIISQFRASDAFKKRAERLVEKQARKHRATRKSSKSLKQRVKGAFNKFRCSSKCSADNLGNLIRELQCILDTETISEHSRIALVAAKS